MPRKKIKREILLEEVFRAIKPSMIIHESNPDNPYTKRYIAGRIKSWRKNYTLEKRNGGSNFYEENWLPQFFAYTKPLTGVTQRMADYLHYNLMIIRGHRREAKRKVHRFTMFNAKEDRLYPLHDDFYEDLAHRKWEEYGKPRWGKHRIDGVCFGEPSTDYYERSNTLRNRTVGVVFRKNHKNKLVLRPEIKDRNTDHR